MILEFTKIRTILIIDDGEVVKMYIFEDLGFSGMVGHGRREDRI